MSYLQQLDHNNAATRQINRIKTIFKEDHFLNFVRGLRFSCLSVQVRSMAVSDSRCYVIIWSPNSDCMQ